MEEMDGEAAWGGRPVELGKSDGVSPTEVGVSTKEEGSVVEDGRGREEGNDGEIGSEVDDGTWGETFEGTSRATGALEVVDDDDGKAGGVTGEDD